MCMCVCTVLLPLRLVLTPGILHGLSRPAPDLGLYGRASSALLTAGCAMNGSRTPLACHPIVATLAAEKGAAGPEILGPSPCKCARARVCVCVCVCARRPHECCKGPEISFMANHGLLCSVHCTHECLATATSEEVCASASARTAAITADAPCLL